jgi:hypothetical protein
MSGQEINEQFLNDLFDKLSSEQMRLLAQMKLGNTEEKDKDIQKQMSFLNTLVTTTLRYRNHKKAMITKLNS